VLKRLCYPSARQIVKFLVLVLSAENRGGGGAKHGADKVKSI
jgi:hypothetical protein